MTVANRNLDLYEVYALAGLSQCAAPITFRQLLEIADPRDKEKLDPEKMNRTLESLVEESFVKRHPATGCAAIKYSITALGRARYSGHSPFGELHASARAQANGAMTDEMRGAVKVDGFSVNAKSPADFFAENKAGQPAFTFHACDPEPPAVATLCVDEDELDDWWESLDVEQKGDAFAGFALRIYSGESHIHICRGERIPVADTLGEETRAAAEASAQ